MKDDKVDEANDKNHKKATEKAEEAEEAPKAKKCYDSDECMDARYTDFRKRDLDMIKDTIKAD